MKILRFSHAMDHLPFIGNIARQTREWASSELIFRRQQLRGVRANLVSSGDSAPSIPLTIQQQWERILKNSPNILANLPEVDKSPVLFMTVWSGSSPVLSALESILAYSVRLRGVRAVSLACGKAFPACVYDPLGNRALPVPPHYCITSLNGTTCRNCLRGVRDYYADTPIEQLFYSCFFNPQDLAKATSLVDGLAEDRYADYVYKDIHVGEHAHASTLRALGRGTLEDDPFHRWLERRQLIAAIVITDLTERALNAIKPRRVMAVHGIYVDHGTICEVAKRMGYPIVVYSVPYRKDAIMLCHGDTYHKALVTEPADLWTNLSLTPEMDQRLDTYVKARQSGKQDSIAYHPNPIEEKSELMRTLDLDPHKPIVSLYTNVIWDAQLYHSYNAFENILDWLYQTVDYFKSRTDLQIVIRIHPAEVKAVKKTEQPLAAELKARYDVLPDHIKVIPPESDLSSYTLVDMSRAALIYGTKMGLEIALRGVPVIIAGESFNRGKGFSYDVSSPDEYFILLDRITELPRNTSEMMESARKYAYHFFFRRQIDFPFLTGFQPGNRLALKLTFNNLDALMPGKNAYLDTICQGMTGGGEFVAE
jgi:hypothetical protein